MTLAHFIQGDATRLPLADSSVELTLTSPPYSDARTYGIGAQRKADEWVEWMLDVVTELTRVTSGLVLVNCAGVTRQRNYWPCCEGLCWEWFKRGGNQWRPAYWHRVGIPGSGGKQWLRADIEYILCFKRDAEWLPWSDNTANGHPPKWGPGGEMSHRLNSGARVNQWGPIGSPRAMGAKNADGSVKVAGRPSHPNGKMSEMLATAGAEPKVAAMLARGFPEGGKLHTKANADGIMRVQAYLPPTLANPGNLIQGITVGGGQLGHPLAHRNEAPFPQKLAEWFIRSWCPPGGTVLDCFSGSGTTVAAANALGRNGIGIDLRMSQCLLGRDRVATPRPAKPLRKTRPTIAYAQSLCAEVA